MSKDRRAIRVQKALECPYTRALRIVRFEGDIVKDWSKISDEELRQLFEDIK